MYESLQKRQQEDAFTLQVTLLNQVEEFTYEFVQIQKAQQQVVRLLDRAN